MIVENRSCAIDIIRMGRLPSCCGLDELGDVGDDWFFIRKGVEETHPISNDKGYCHQKYQSDCYEYYPVF